MDANSTIFLTFCLFFAMLCAISFLHNRGYQRFYSMLKDKFSINGLLLKDIICVQKIYNCKYAQQRLFI